ncbi:hypothetical protein JOE11_002874 [Robbsia andropogonis]
MQFLFEKTAQDEYIVSLLNDLLVRAFYVTRDLIIHFLRNIVRQHGVSVMDLFFDSSRKGERI